MELNQTNKCQFVELYLANIYMTYKKWVYCVLCTGFVIVEILRVVGFVIPAELEPWACWMY